jgi:hypothetical protein
MAGKYALTVSVGLWMEYIANCCWRLIKPLFDYDRDVGGRYSEFV